MVLEKYDGHALVLAAGAIVNGVKVLEFENSYGRDWGYDGFIKIALSKYLIKQVFEFKVSLFDIFISMYLIFCRKKLMKLHF